MRRVVLSAALSLAAVSAGCVQSQSEIEAPPENPVTQPALPPASQAAVQPPVPTVPPDRILLQFGTIDCVCNLGNIEIALLDIPSVQSLDWELEQTRLWLNFTDNRRPSDDDIRRALQYQNVTLTRIYRP